MIAQIYLHPDTETILVVLSGLSGLPRMQHYAWNASPHGCVTNHLNNCTLNPCRITEHFILSVREGSASLLQGALPHTLLLPKAPDHRWGKEWRPTIKSAASQQILCQSAGESPACQQHPANLNQSAHSSLFWLKTMVSVLEVLIFLPANSKSAVVHPGGPWWCQKNHIICKEQRCGTEDTKGQTLSTWLCLEILYINFIIRICDKGQYSGPPEQVWHIVGLPVVTQVDQHEWPVAMDQSLSTPEAPPTGCPEVCHLMLSPSP